MNDNRAIHRFDLRMTAKQKARLDELKAFTEMDGVTVVNEAVKQMFDNKGLILPQDQPTTGRTSAKRASRKQTPK